MFSQPQALEWELYSTIACSAHPKPWSGNCIVQLLVQSPNCIVQVRIWGSFKTQSGFIQNGSGVIQRIRGHSKHGPGSFKTDPGSFKRIRGHSNNGRVHSNIGRVHSNFRRVHSNSDPGSFKLGSGVIQNKLSGSFKIKPGSFSRIRGHSAQLGFIQIGSGVIQTFT